MNNGFPWYQIVTSESPLEQGDFLPEFPVIIPPDEIRPGMRVEVDVETINAIIITQSCDIYKSSVKRILVCPIYTLEEMSKKNPSLESPEERESIRRGYYFGFHLLNRCELSGYELDYLVVDFQNVSSVDKNFLLKFTKDLGNRKRLLSPYKEHLSQSFARFFMRVGLPVDIPPFE